MESELKLERYVRDVPKYERMKAQLNEVNGDDEAEEREAEAKRDSIDNLFFAGRAGSAHYTREEPYSPAMYKIVKDKNKMKERESLQQIQEGFLERTERVMRQHKVRSQIHDGLKHLSNPEII